MLFRLNALSELIYGLSLVDAFDKETSRKTFIVTTSLSISLVIAGHTPLTRWGALT